MHSNWRFLSKNKNVIGINLAEERYKQSSLKKDELASMFMSKSDFFSTIAGKETEEPSEMLRALLPLVRCYRLFGFFPVSIKKGYTGISYKPYSPFWIISGVALFIQLIMIGTSTRDLVNSFNKPITRINDEVQSANQIFYYVQTFVMFLLMLSRIESFPVLITACKHAEKMCAKYNYKKDYLIMDCWLLFLYFVSVQVCGNCLYYYSEVTKSNASSVEGYVRTFTLDGGYFDNFGISGYCLMIFEFYCDCGWTFGDTVIALFSCALTRYYSRLNQGIASSLVESAKEIEQLRSDHRQMKDLVEQFNKLFGPIILINFIGNVGYLLSRLYTGVAEDLNNPKLIIRFESVYAFIYQILKILVPTWFAARLHEIAHEAVNSVHSWPSRLDSVECKDRILVIGRFVAHLANDPVAISACGYFSITKGFLVTLISGLMTYEVVILQFHQAGL